MKNIIASLALVLLANAAFAQAPNKFNYQGIARNAAGAPIAAQSLGLRITIHDGSATGTTVYQETQSVMTNSYGLYSTAIGTGTIITGTMAGINWSMGDKYMQVEIDPAGGTSYTDAGTTQLLSVPYAMSASKFAIPYYDSMTNAGSLLKLQNNGDGSAVEAVNNSTSSSIAAVKGVVNSTAPGGFSSAVRGQNNGTGGLGIGVYGSQAGSGWGVYGTTPTGIGVYGNCTSGYGVYGSTSTGTAVEANASGTGAVVINANYSGTGVGTSLQMVNGAIKVAGTNKSAFVHTATVANKLSANGTDVDNPFCNGDANAILIVTQKMGSGVIYNNASIGVYYNTTRNKWEIFNENSVAIPTGAQFNVLVIKQ